MFSYIQIAPNQITHLCRSRTLQTDTTESSGLVQSVYLNENLWSRPEDGLCIDFVDKYFLINV